MSARRYPAEAKVSQSSSRSSKISQSADNHVRPTNHRIEQLEQENAALRQQCLQLGSGHVPIAGDISRAQAESTLASTSPTQSHNTALLRHRLDPSPSDYPSSRGRDTSHPEVPDSDNRRNSASLYHGPTSTVYDDTANLEHNGENVEPLDSPVREEWTRHLLFAQTARQSKCALNPVEMVFAHEIYRATGAFKLCCRQIRL